MSVVINVNIEADTVRNILTIPYDIINSGRTPAYKFRRSVKCYIHPFTKAILDSILKLPFRSYTFGAGGVDAQHNFVQLKYEILGKGKFSFFFAINMGHKDIWDNLTIRMVTGQLIPKEY